MTRPIPGYFFPLLSREDAARRDAVAEYARYVRDEPPSERRETLVYVHVPFCRTHCAFCGYYRQTSHDQALFEAYVDRVLAELDAWIETGCLDFSEVSAVYVGGGTPSLFSPPLSARLLAGLRSRLNLPKGVELTFEGEATTLKDQALLDVLREHRVTRCSFGVQSFDPDVRRLSRIGASLCDVAECIEALRRYGYPLCVDLMYGLPGQSTATFIDDLRRSVEVEGASLLDLYPVVHYPNAPLYRQDRDARAELPAEDERRRMYDGALRFFEERGFLQYTFEDFCQPGHEYSMKRLTYGASNGGAQTLALGACAVGYLGGHAYRNALLEEYRSVPPDELPIALLRRANLDEQRRRALFFYPRRLRLDPAELSLPLTDADLACVERHLEQGLSKRELDGALTLTREGRLRADDMVLDLLSSDERRKLFRLVQ